MNNKLTKQQIIELKKAMTKAALISLSESLYFDLKPAGIKLQIICPGFVESEATSVNDFKMPILTTMIKKKFFNKNKFDKRYNIIGDFDLFVRMSIKNKIGVIQEPLAYYRLHKNNLSLKKVDLNVNELKNWLLEKSKKKVFKGFDFDCCTLALG